jgi:hypothetical protein
MIIKVNYKFIVDGLNKISRNTETIQYVNVFVLPLHQGDPSILANIFSQLVAGVFLFPASVLALFNLLKTSFRVSQVAFNSGNSNVCLEVVLAFARS